MFYINYFYIVTCLRWSFRTGSICLPPVKCLTAPIRYHIAPRCVELTILVAASFAASASVIPGYFFTVFTNLIKLSLSIFPSLKIGCLFVSSNEIKVNF